jgi:phospholipase A2
MLLGGTLLARTLTVASAPHQENNFGAENSYSKLVQDGIVEKVKTIEEDDGSIVKPKLLHRSEIKLSKQTAYFEDGSLPMPIYCAVRHEIGVPSAAKANTISNQDNVEPCEEVDQEKEKEKEPELEDNKEEDENGEEVENTEDETKDLYQWFEFTPFEMGSEEINGKTDISINFIY